MSEEIVIGGTADMTKKEAEKSVELFVAHANVSRWLLLDMFDRKAHKALGYGDWAEFCNERLGLLHSNSYHSDLLRAARVEKAITGKSSDYQNFSENTKPEIPIQTALVLAKLPTAEDQKEAYAEVLRMKAHGVRSEREIFTQLKNIVTRRLNILTQKEEQAKPKQADKPKTEEPKKKDDAKPAVSSFTPPADPEPEEEDAVFDEEEVIAPPPIVIDDEMEWNAEVWFGWCHARQIIDKEFTRQQVADSLEKGVALIRAGLK